MNISIIGTAGRATDGDRLKKDDFGTMFLAVNRICRELSREKNYEYNLVSGGAAWADHLAVFSFILGIPNKLFLELPCYFTEGGEFLDTGVNDYKTNPGRTSNYYHQLFSKKTGIDSLLQLKSVAEKPNCVTSCGEGFFERNSKIAEKSDHCIALTFGDKDVLKDGGTADTMTKFLKKGTGKSFHIDLNTMEVYSPARVKLN